MNNRWRFNFWLLLQCLLGVSFYISTTQGFNPYTLLLTYDITFISLAIIGLYICASAVMGYLILFGEERESADWIIFISENTITLGLMGTIIGLMIAVGSLFGLNLTEQADAAKGIQQMSNGVAVAMITTLTGVLTSFLLKIQLMLWIKTID